MNGRNRRDFLKLSTAALTAASLGKIERASATSEPAATRRPKPMAHGTMSRSANDPQAGEALMAGVAQVDITPPPGLVMYGYESRINNNIVTTGTLDPLYARVLVLAMGNTRLALVTLDLGRVYGKPLLDEIQRSARQNDNISDLVVTASHTHSGPNILDIYSPGQTPEWETDQIHKIETAIGRACEKLVPVRVGAGYGSCFIGFNRIELMRSRNTTKVPTAPVDPTVGVVRIDTMDGTPLAILVNYACHTTIFGGTNLKYSADWPGVMINTVEQAFGGKPICFFLQGACGDINPYYSDSTPESDDVSDCHWTGETLGHETIRVAQGIQTISTSTPSLQSAEDVLRVKLRWNPVEFRDGLLSRFGPKVFEDHADLMVNEPVPYLEMPVTTWMVDKQIAFACMPGEPFVDFQIEWRTRCPVRNPFFMGYTNGYFDYIPTVEAASKGGYGAGDSNTYVEVGTGERFVLQSVIRTYGFLGGWYELPKDLRGPTAGALPSNRYLQKT